jgi:addiction module HigA family antidote
MKMKKIPYPHPGEALKEDWMEPLGLSAYRVAKALGVSQTAVGQLLGGRRAVSPEMALRLERITGASADFWLGLQAGHDLDLARGDRALERKLREMRPLGAA